MIETIELGAEAVILKSFQYTLQLDGPQTCIQAEGDDIEVITFYHPKVEGENNRRYGSEYWMKPEDFKSMGEPETITVTVAAGDTMQTPE